MRMRIWLGLCVSLIAATASAQPKPDFTGEWSLVAQDNGATDAAPTLSVRHWFEHVTSPRGVPVDIPHLAIERRFGTDVNSEHYQIGLSGGVVGGVAGGVVPGSVPGWSTRFLVTWDGDTLVISIGKYSGPARESGPYSERDEAWSLAAPDSLVITVTERSAGAEPRTVKLKYGKP